MSRNFPNFIEAVVQANSKTKIPERFTRWAAISAVAGALGRKVWYDAGAFTIYPNMYIALVGAPGSGKSVSLLLPILKVLKGLTTPIGTKPQDQSWNPRLERYHMEEYPLYLEKDKITPEALMGELERTHRVHPSLSTGDELYHENAMTLVTGEFGTFMQRDAQHAQVLLTELWNGEPDYTYRTKTAGVNIVKGPALNWIACATPEQFVTNLPGNARSQGLLSRMLPIYYEGEKLEESLHYDSASDDMVDRLREDLADIASLRGQVRFHDGLFEQANEDVRNGFGNRPTDPNLAEYAERRTAHIIKLAAAICCASRRTRVICPDDWEAAKRILLDAEAHMPKALRGFGAGRVETTVIEVDKYIRSLLNGREGGVPAMKVRRQLLKVVATPQEVEATLTAMDKGGMIEMNDNMITLRG